MSDGMRADALQRQLESLQRQVNAWFLRSERAEAQVAAVRAIHVEGGGTCIGCWEAGGEDGGPTWPCPTIRVIDALAATIETKEDDHG